VVFSNLGRAYTFYGRLELRIHEHFRDSVVYLYPDKIDADLGQKVGASGFLVGYPSEVFPDTEFTYLVTNDHVYKNCRAIRINRTDGSTEVIEIPEKEWFPDPSGNDIAICPIGLAADHKAECIPVETFITQEVIERANLGCGDHVFMIGRFVGHDGTEYNNPSVRFGNISMMPGEPILQERRKHPQESFIVEGHSISGYSGSPVFVYVQKADPRPNQKPIPEELWQGQVFFRLLGMDWGHIPTRWTAAVDENGLKNPGGWGFKINSGMMGVVPAWQILALLEHPHFTMQRKIDSRELRKLKEHAGELDIELSGREKPFTKADFETALKKVSRKQKH